LNGTLATYNDTTKVPKIADNAQNVFLSEVFNYRCGEFIFATSTTAVGTGSSGTWGSVENIGRWATADASKNIYGKLIANSAWTPKLGGWVRVEMSGIQEIIVP
jgi:hypothetical protein